MSMAVQIVVLAIPEQAGGWPLHIILILRLFRMWRVVKFLEVFRLGLPRDMVKLAMHSQNAELVMREETCSLKQQCNQCLQLPSFKPHLSRYIPQIGIPLLSEDQEQAADGRAVHGGLCE